MAEQIKIVVTGSQITPSHDEWAQMQAAGLHLTHLPTTAEDEIIAGSQDARGMIGTFGPNLTRKTFASLPNLQLLVFCSVGFDRVDVGAATEFGVAVANSPTFCIEEVADTASMHILNCARRLPQQLSTFQKHGWDVRKGMSCMAPVNRISRQTLGFVGFGRIGQGAAENLAGFGMRYLVYDPFISPEVAGAWNATKVSLEELCRVSDIISVHAPHNADTHHLLTTEQFRMMKSTAHVVNSSRGPVIDESALIEALRNGWIGGAGLDVLEQEPPTPENPLLSMDNVLLTAHTASFSIESLIDNRRHAAAEVIQVFKGRNWPSALINPEVKSKARVRSWVSSE